MQADTPGKHTFALSGKTVTVYAGGAPDSAVVFLNTFGDEGDRAYQALRACGCPAFTLVTVSGLVWDHDMAPWDIPPIAPGDTPCTGGADDYLRLLTGEIVPRAEQFVPGRVLWRGIAGYSLAGLFAVYSLCQTDLFARAASISGSLWFPGFADYVLLHGGQSRPSHLYFSLGDRESRTKNPLLRTVQQNTEQIERFYARQGADTIFQLNPGGHYQNAAQRTAAGIAWLLNR